MPPVLSVGGHNFAFRVHHRMATATGSAGGMCGECVAAPTQQEGMLDTHDTALTLTLISDRGLADYTVKGT